MGQSLAIPRVIPNDWKRLDLIVNKIKMRLGRDGSPTFANTYITNTITASTSVFSKICTAAAGLSVLRVTGLQTDDTALTGTLRGGYIDVSNGALDATGTIRALELKARTEAPGDTGNDVAVLEGLSISADSKGHGVTTMRAAEFILDGSTGGTIGEAVGLRIANNLQADKATLSYGLQIYRDSFDYTADIQLSDGSVINKNGYWGIGTATPNSEININREVDGEVSEYIENTSTGTSAFTTLNLSSGDGRLFLHAFGSSYTAYPFLTHKAVLQDTSESTGLALIARNATGIITLSIGGLGSGNEVLRIGATGLTLTSGKMFAGSFGSPTDVTNTREYGFELHYSGNNYNVTGIRSRARLKTTDTTATAQGALLQAANEDGIDVGVLNGALIEAIGKSDSTAATISMMRGCLVNTEWNAKDTVTDLCVLHVRTHTRNAATEGYVSGTGYGICIENEAVGGNGQALDAGIYFKGTNLSAGNKAFTYGIDFSGGTYGTSQINLIANGSITMAGTRVIKFDDTNFNTFLGEGAFNNDDGTYNTCVGYHTGYYNDISTGKGYHNVYLGYLAGRGHAGGNKGYENVAIGSSALLGCTTGFNNFALGTIALTSLNTGSNNVAIGNKALSNITDARFNMAIGASALQNIIGERNVAIGFNAMAGTSGGTAGSNVAIGHYAQLNQDDGLYNVVIGAHAGQSVSGNTYNNNVCIGYYSGFALLAGGDDNIFIGYQSGMNQTTNSSLLIIDNQDRGSAAAEITNCLIYGIFDATVTTQSIRFNAGNLSLVSGTPYQYLINDTHEDGDGGRESRLIFKGEQTGGELTTLARIEVGHDGDADDQKGYLDISINDGNDGDNPTKRIRMDAAGNTKIGDGGTTNYTQWSATGVQTMYASARVTKYSWVHAGGVRGGGLKGATEGLNDNGWIVLTFPDVGGEKYGQANIKVPDDMDLSEDSYLCVGWSSTATTNTCSWTVSYLLTALGQSTDDTPTGSTTVYPAPSGNTNGLVMSTIVTIPGDTITDEQCIHVQIMRDPDDDALGADVEFHGAAFQYTANKLGA